MKKRSWIATIVTVAVLAACASPNTGGSSDSPTATPDPATEILTRIGSPRLSEMTTAGTVATVVGSATDAAGDATRTMWYANVAAAAYAQEVPIDQANRQIVDDSDKVLVTELDLVSAGDQDAFAPLSTSPDDMANAILPGAKSQGVRIVSVVYVELFGGIAEFVVQPDDLDAFVASASTNIPSLLGELAAREQWPYLITIVNGDGSPQLVMGYTPGVGAIGQGIAWAAPGVKTDVIWGQSVGG